MSARYVELRARSAFSFADGVLTPEALASAAAEREYPALALVDRAELGGLVRFAREAERLGVRPIAGAELLVDGYPLAVLARTQEGYRNLAGLISEARLSSPRGHPSLPVSSLLRRAAGLHLLTGSPTGLLSTLVRQEREIEARRTLAAWKEAFEGRVAVEVQLHCVSHTERLLAEELIRLAGHLGVPWVATNEPRYLNDSGRLLHDLFTALRAGTDIVSATRRGLLLPNGEWRLKSSAEMAAAFRDKQAGLEESVRIADECAFELQWLRPPLPGFPAGPGQTENGLLRELVHAGGRERWGKIGSRETAQIDHELSVIQRLGFAGFFLQMWDAVRFARSRGITCQGRGSAANSAVAFCLGITAVDPVRENLLFERFLSEARTDGLTEAPDIDVDFEMHRREEVLDYVYRRHGREKAALTGMTETFHAPSAVQDLMRVLGYPAEAALRLSKRLHGRTPSEGAEMIQKELAQSTGFNLTEPRARVLLSALRTMDGLPRMRATHPGGFVLSSGLLGDYLPIEPTTMGRTILQFDKDDLDEIGVPKFDFLGLGGLTAVRLAFDAIQLRTGKPLDLHRLPQDDPETYAMIARGDTLGTFQIESRAQIASLVQTRPERLYDLVVQVALIRPGPIQARFVHPYTRRRRGLEPVTYAHPALEAILERTCGIPIFQEQAMRISMVLGGYTAAESDELRRAMGSERKLPRLLAALQGLRSRMVGRGVPADTAEKIVEDLRSFSNYGFPESHAWSFALIAYATAWLKANHPAEFLLGLLNAWPMGFYSPATLVHDARRGGVEVRPPCLKVGEWDCTLEETGNSRTPAVRIGWRHIRGLGEKARERLRQAHAAGPFGSIEEVVRRARLNRDEALHLARAGALEVFEPGRRAAAWEALRVVGDTFPLAPSRALPFRPQELEGHERIFLDYLATGISVDGHPIQHLRARLQSCGVLGTAELAHAVDGERVLVAGLVVVRQRPATGKGTVFLLLEDENGFVNVIVPPKLYQENRETVKFSPFLLVEGRFERNGTVLNVTGWRFRRLNAPAPAAITHDFH
ncbi:MAG: error-prone DNA polymerase [Gemmatimonadota bacterium]|nr:error-prone DNA polymerase [Gemmatimonadota bacterium]